MSIWIGIWRNLVAASDISLCGYIVVRRDRAAKPLDGRAFTGKMRHTLCGAPVVRISLMVRCLEHRRLSAAV